MQFSSRLPALLEDNALARAVAARRKAGKVIYDLTLSNPTQAGFKYPTPEISMALAAGAKAKYAPEPRGLLSARKAIAGYYRGHGQAAVNPEHLHLTASTSEAYAYLFKLLGEPGAEVLAPLPSYPLIEHLAALEGWHTRHYPLGYHANSGWRLDHAALAAAITPATRAIVVIHPHNPTGWTVRSPDAHFLLETCARHGIALIADEVFLDYPAPDGKGKLESFAANEVSALTFTLGGLSKCAGLPQLKLGWIHTGGPRHLADAARPRLDFIADAYLSAATPVQAALPKLFSAGKKVSAQIRHRLADNYAALASLDWPEGFTVLPHTAGWCALLQRPTAPDEELLARKILERTGVLAHPGYYYDFNSSGPGWHVLSLLPEPKIFRRGVEFLCEWLPRLV